MVSHVMVTPVQGHRLFCSNTAVPERHCFMYASYLCMYFVMHCNCGYLNDIELCSLKWPENLCYTESCKAVTAYD